MMSIMKLLVATNVASLIIAILTGRSESMEEPNFGVCEVFGTYDHNVYDVKLSCSSDLIKVEWSFANYSYNENDDEEATYTIIVRCTDFNDQVTTLWYGDDRRYYTTTLADTVDSYNTTDVSKNFTGCTVFSCLEVSLFGDLYLDSGTCNITSTPAPTPTPTANLSTTTENTTTTLLRSPPTTRSTTKTTKSSTTPLHIRPPPITTTITTTIKDSTLTSSVPMSLFIPYSVWYVIIGLLSLVILVIMGTAMMIGLRLVLQTKRKVSLLAFSNASANSS